MKRAPMKRVPLDYVPPGPGTTQEVAMPRNFCRPNFGHSGDPLI